MGARAQGGFKVRGDDEAEGVLAALFRTRGTESGGDHHLHDVGVARIVDEDVGGGAADRPADDEPDEGKDEGEEQPPTVDLFRIRSRASLRAIAQMARGCMIGLLVSLRRAKPGHLDKYLFQRGLLGMDGAHMALGHQLRQARLILAIVHFQRNFGQMTGVAGIAEGDDEGAFAMGELQVAGRAAGDEAPLDDKGETLAELVGLFAGTITYSPISPFSKAWRTASALSKRARRMLPWVVAWSSPPSSSTYPIRVTWAGGLTFLDRKWKRPMPRRARKGRRGRGRPSRCGRRAPPPDSSGGCSSGWPCPGSPVRGSAP
jgi:hypothetical protein